MESVNLIGVFPVGPEHFLCALLQRPSNGRCIPVWLPPFEGAQLAARLEGWAPNRPRTIDALVDVIAQSTQGVDTIELSSYLNGMFMATVTMRDGAEFDTRASDALLLAAELEMEIGVDETVAAQASIYLSQEDARSYFGEGIQIAAPADEDTSASGDEEADRDFEALMRSLGADDLSLDDETDVTGDDPDKGGSEE